MINSTLSNQLSKIKKAANDAKKAKDVAKKLDYISDALYALAELESKKIMNS